MNLQGAVAFNPASNRGVWNTPLTDFAPRIGIAYKITNKLVFRTGYGIYFVPELARITTRQIWAMGRIIPNFSFTSMSPTDARYAPLERMSVSPGLMRR